MKKATDFIITLKDGRLAATHFPDDKRLLSEVVAILSNDWIKRGGVVKYK